MSIVLWAVLGKAKSVTAGWREHQASFVYAGIILWRFVWILDNSSSRYTSVESIENSLAYTEGCHAK